MAKEDFPGGSDGKEIACNAGDPGSDPGLGRSPGEGNGYPLQYSCLKNSMDHGAWRGDSPWGRKESDMTERHFHIQEWLLKQSLGTKRGHLVARGEISQFSHWCLPHRPWRHLGQDLEPHLFRQLLWSPPKRMRGNRYTDLWALKRDKLRSIYLEKYTFLFIPHVLQSKHIRFYFSSVQSLSRIQLCDPMDCSTPGFPVHHQFPQFTQTHVRWVSDVIQPSKSLLSPSPLTFNLSQHQGLFKWVTSLTWTVWKDFI